MTEFDDVLDAINEGLNSGMPGPVEEEQPEIDVEVSAEEGVPGESSDDVAPNIAVAAEVISKLTKEGTWEEALQVYAEEHEMEIEAVKAEVISALATAGIELAEPEVEVEVAVSEVPTDAPELDNELPQE